ncbi:MAG: hypothetical protein ACI87W_001706 [Halieaceae bacterium]|jgi:hypothetical protein
MDNAKSTSLDRRTLLAAAGLALIPGVPAAVHAAPQPGELVDSADLKDPWMDDPQRQFENFLRSQGDLSGRVSPQWWRGAVLAIFAGRPPEVLFRLESCEMKRIKQLGTGEYEFQFRLFTCFKDPETDDMLNGLPWLNPLNGEKTIIQPVRATFARIIKLTDSGIVEIDPDTGREVQMQLHWTARGPYMMYNGAKDYPEDLSKPGNPFATSIQYMTAFHDREAAANFSASRLEMQFNATHVGPFPSWMKMPADAGVAVWHASGHKADNVSNLPPAYLHQLFKYMPELHEWLDDDYSSSTRRSS